LFGRWSSVFCPRSGYYSRRPDLHSPDFLSAKASRIVLERSNYYNLPLVSTKRKTIQRYKGEKDGLLSTITQTILKLCKLRTWAGEYVANSPILLSGTRRVHDIPRRREAVEYSIDEFCLGFVNDFPNLIDSDIFVVYVRNGVPTPRSLCPFPNQGTFCASFLIRVKLFHIWIFKGWR
jgi:hypothetical protein